jgi:hypothetical protein
LQNSAASLSLLSFVGENEYSPVPIFQAKL